MRLIRRAWRLGRAAERLALRKDGNQVIRPFGLQDIWLVRRLQHTGMTLAVEHMLTHPHDPLWTALTAPWPWAGVGVATYVLDEDGRGQQLQGFAQLMKRASRPEADLLHVAPAILAPAIGDRPATIWSRLLAHVALAAATHGLQRIFASAPEGCFEQTSLRQAGFCLYTRETLYRLAEIPALDDPAFDSVGLREGMRPQHPRDSWSLQRLYARGTPRLVQQAEGALDGAAGSPILSWWEPHEWQGFVWEPAGETRGAAQIHRGRSGHWLRLLGAGELSTREVRLLITQGLQALANQRSLPKRPVLGERSAPVYVTVREYDSNLSGALISFGFAPFAERARFVKHTAAVVRVAEPVTAGVSRQATPEMARHS